MFVVDAAKRLHKAMTSVQRRMAPPSAALLELVTSQWRPRALGVVARLGIADLLASGPRSTADLAAAAGCNEDALYRLMRALAHDGIFAQPEPGRFALTPLSDPLRSDHPASIRSTVIMSTAEYNQRSWERLEQCVRTGQPAFRELYGGDVWTYFESHPAEGRDFHRSMQELTRLTGPLLAACYDFGQHARIVDVGGGAGELMVHILDAYPGVRGAIYDLEPSTRDAPETLRAAGVADRCEVIAGDLFQGVPEGYDAYVLKHIVHGLRDEELATPFANLRKAMRPTSRLLLMEMLVPEDEGGVHPAHLDLQMLVSSGGRERTRTEYARLLEQHGFHLLEVHRNPSPTAVLEAMPA